MFIVEIMLFCYIYDVTSKTRSYSFFYIIMIVIRFLGNLHRIFQSLAINAMIIIIPSVRLVPMIKARLENNLK